ncbi:MAG TPA: hypothetical protein VMX55_02950 [candidate division Zixibacteria bacterium]|nr:hypothetical protein [candidate division Zixibacteria bacterium]
MPEKSDTSMGTLSLIMAILGCVQILPCIGPLLAIIFGRQARGTAGESTGKIGKILGWITLCLIFVPGIVFIIGIFVLGWFGIWP